MKKKKKKKGHLSSTDIDTLSERAMDERAHVCEDFLHYWAVLMGRFRRASWDGKSHTCVNHYLDSILAVRLKQNFDRPHRVIVLRQKEPPLLLCYCCGC